VIYGEVSFGRPFITGFIVLPRLMLGDEISFLVDTGADRTVIQPRDAVKLGIEHQRTFAGAPVVVSRGIGGNAEEYVEPGLVLFRHNDEKWDHLLVLLYFAKPTPENASDPSILGRDVISYYRLVFEQRAGLVTLANTAQQA